jgi:hypothetical protein
MTDAIEIPVRHRCHLGMLVDGLADHARLGERGAPLAERAQRALADLLLSGKFDTCCVPEYLAVAPERFERELQVPVAAAHAARLDARVLLWPVGAKDVQHPHADGWAVFAAVRGRLAAHEMHDGQRLPERALRVNEPEVVRAVDGITHHLHNRGDEVGLSVHVFGE